LKIPLPFFLHLFDSSVGSDFADEEQLDDKAFTLKDVDVSLEQADTDEQLDELGDGEQKKRRELAARRKASLRLGSASSSMKRRKGRRGGTLNLTQLWSFPTACHMNFSRLFFCLGIY